MSILREKILKLVGPFVHIPVTGLDISDRTIKYLQFNHLIRTEFNFFGEMDLPEGLIINGEIIEEENLTKFLKTWLARDGKFVQTSAIVASLPEEKSFLRIIQIPKIKKEDVSNAIRWEIESNIPLPPDQVAYDYKIIEHIEDHLDHFDVLLIAFPKNLVESYNRVLKNCGLLPLALEHESQAIIRAVVPDLKDTSAKIIVDMGRNRTSFIIFAGGSMDFTTTIELGGRILEENIMREMRVTAEEAASIKKQVGLSRTEYEGRVFNALAPAVAVLADELKRALDYYHGRTTHLHGASKEITEVLLTGGDSNLQGLDTYLAGSLKVPILRGDPLSALSKMTNFIIPPLPQNKLAEYTTVIGLALRNIR